MTDDLTPEQRDADDALTAAIEAHCKAYGGLEEGWALGDFIVCLEFQPFAEELVNRQRYAYITSSDHMPTHRLLGLLDLTINGLRKDEE